MSGMLSSAYTDRKTWHDSGVVGVPVRVHDLTGDDLGVDHVPPPVEPGDLVLLEHARPARLRPLVSCG
jgi:hypothetical protein